MVTQQRHPVTTEELLKLRDEGLSYTQISAKVGMSKGNISKRLAAWEKEKITRDLPRLPAIDIKKNPMTIDKALGAIHDIEKKVDQVDRHIKNSKTKADKLPWEKLRTKLLSEKRRWLAFGSDMEFQMAQNYQVKEVLHIIMQEIGRESKELQTRILHRLESIGTA